MYNYIFCLNLNVITLAFSKWLSKPLFSYLCRFKTFTTERNVETIQHDCVNLSEWRLFSIKADFYFTQLLFIESNCK